MGDSELIQAVAEGVRTDLRKLAPFIERDLKLIEILHKSLLRARLINSGRIDLLMRIDASEFKLPPIHALKESENGTN